MNFSKMNLVAFGDSYTFGQNVSMDANIDVIEREISKQHPCISAYYAGINTWRERSHNDAYPQQLASRLGVNKTINLALPGIGNDHIYDAMYNYVSENDTSKDFFVIGLSDTDRQVNYTKQLIDVKKSSTLSFLDSFYLTKIEDTHKSGNKPITEVEKYFYKETAAYYTYIFNEYTELYKYVINYNNIINLLEKNNIPYIIFDCINTANYYHNEETFSKHMDHSHIQLDTIRLYSEKTHYFNFAPNKLVIDYFKNIKKDKKYLNMFTFKEVYQNRKIPVLNFSMYYDDPLTKTYQHMYDFAHNSENYKNLDSVIIWYGEHILNDIDMIRSPVPNDSHWNKRGNKLAAILLADWIKVVYGSGN